MTRLALILIPLLLAGQLARAQDVAQAPATHPFKLTVGLYDYAGDQGKDVNLRWSHGDTHAWIGHYEDDSFGSQARIGVDTSVDVTELVSLQPSLQAATGGYAGASLNAQVGHVTYGIVGWGRTNLKPYFNLNFDPNDAITLGCGHVFDDGQNWSVFVVRDDRLHTGQTDWHLTGRVPLDSDRLSLDLMRKTGEGDEGPVKAWSWSITWDFPSWFLRLAHDPKQNFSGTDATRLATGWRF